MKPGACADAVRDALILGAAALGLVIALPIYGVCWLIKATAR